MEEEKEIYECEVLASPVKEEDTASTKETFKNLNEEELESEKGEF